MLEVWAQRLTIPGLPEWSGLAVLLVLILLVLCVLVMPFSVFGVKGRLDSIEAQLDDLRADIRALAARGIPLATRDEAPPPSVAAAPPETHGRRAEPRINWPQGR
ncbi:hypothetical protein [Roseococcus suduntuyensis]|uniref:Uncharacterized protein n=1 Tax=Roseococcus suduntuyensis TaxID=455361 RepID=A0A840AEN6_9PROT|nr:hypothetical protein [Roseococcus suduntuyensis]MBB3899581.1 hypothetical protein [Roseococcus suduntuyensis]